jgi:hypothetical protein
MTYSQRYNKRETGVGAVQLTIPTCQLKSDNIINIYQIRNYVNFKYQIVSVNLNLFQDFGNKFGNRFMVFCHINQYIRIRNYSNYSILILYLE